MDGWNAITASAVLVMERQQGDAPKWRQMGRNIYTDGRMKEGNREAGEDRQKEDGGTVDTIPPSSSLELLFLSLLPRSWLRWQTQIFDKTRTLDKRLTGSTAHDQYTRCHCTVFISNSRLTIIQSYTSFLRNNAEQQPDRVRISLSNRRCDVISQLGQTKIWR